MPKSDGGAQIKHYLVEKKGEKEAEFSAVAEVTDLSYTVSGLEGDCGYTFAITAVNEKGAGKRLETDSVVKTKPVISKS